MKRKIFLVLWISLSSISCGLLTSEEDKIKEAQDFISGKQYNSAVVQLKSVLQDNANNANARYLLGKLYFDLGNYAGALKELDRAFNAGMKTAEIVQLQMSSALQSQSFEKIADILNTSELSGLLPPDDINGYKGWVMLSEKQLTIAKKSFDESLKTNNRNYAANLGLVQYHLNKENQKIALAQLDRALEMYPGDVVFSLFKARILASQKQYKLAQGILENVVHDKSDPMVTPRNIEARIVLIRVLLAQKFADKASEEINDAYRISARHPIIAYFKAFDLFQNKKLNESWEILLKVIEDIPGHNPSLLLLGTISYQEGNFEQATLYLSQFLNNNKTHSPAIKMLSASQLRLDQSDKALATLTPVLEGGDFDVLKLAGVAAIASGDAGRGAEFLESAISDNPDDLNVRVELAKAYLSMGDKNAAKKELRGVIDETNADTSLAAFSMLVNLHLKEKNYDLAMTLARKEAKQNAKSPLFPNIIGQIEARQKAFEQAKASFKKSLALDENYWPAGLNLAKVYLVQKETRKAESVYQDLLNNNAKNTKILWDRARYFVSARKTNAAISDLETIISVNPENIQAARLLIGLFNKLGKKEEGELILANLSKTKKGKKFVQYVKGNAALKQGDIKLAIDTYEGIVAENPKSFVGYFDLAKAYLRNNEQSSARTAIDKSLKIKPDFLPAQSLDIKMDIVAKRYKAADKKIGRLIKQYPENALGNELKGDVLLAQERFSKAAVQYKKSSGKSRNVGIFLKYTRALYRSGEKKTAQNQLLTKLTSIKQADRSAIQMELVRIYKKEGLTTKRVDMLNQMAKENKNHFGKLNDIAWLLHYDDPKQALKYAAAAHTLKPGLAPVKDTYGWILLKNGKVEQALPLLAEANKLMPNVPEMEYHLAVAQFESKQTSSAKKIFKKLVESNGSFEGKEEIPIYLSQIP